MSEGSYLNNDLNMTDGFSVILFSSASQLLAHCGAHKAPDEAFLLHFESAFFVHGEGDFTNRCRSCFPFSSCMFIYRRQPPHRVLMQQTCFIKPVWKPDIETPSCSSVFLRSKVTLDAKIIAGTADWVALNFWIKLLMVSSYMNIFCQNWLSIKSDINSH